MQPVFSLKKHTNPTPATMSSEHNTATGSDKLIYLLPPSRFIYLPFALKDKNNYKIKDISYAVLFFIFFSSFFVVVRDAICRLLSLCYPLVLFDLVRIWLDDL